VKDVSSDREAVRELVGVYKSRSTPTIVIGEAHDQHVTTGFDPDQLMSWILSE